MIIIVSDFHKDVLQAIEQAELQGELEYHLREYGCKPKKVYILPFFVKRWIITIYIILQLIFNEN